MLHMYLKNFCITTSQRETQSDSEPHRCLCLCLVRNSDKMPLHCARLDGERIRRMYDCDASEYDGNDAEDEEEENKICTKKLMKEEEEVEDV